MSEPKFVAKICITYRQSVLFSRTDLRSVTVHRSRVRATIGSGTEAYLRSEGGGSKGSVVIDQFILLVNRKSKARGSDGDEVGDGRSSPVGRSLCVRSVW